MERSINEAYGDDKKIQIIRNVDDEINIDLSKLNADGSTSSLDAAITVDLLTDSYVTSQQVGGANRINLTGASPDFTRDEFLAHVQARINTALNSYASANATQKAALGIEKLQFTRAAGTTIDTIYETNDVITFNHTSNAYGNPAMLVHPIKCNKEIWFTPTLIISLISVSMMGNNRSQQLQLMLMTVLAMLLIRLRTK